MTDAVFGHLASSFPGRRNAARLMTAGRRANTWLGYAGKLKHWEDFCAQAGVRPFPAQPAHVLCYLGYLQEEGVVKAGSLQPYLSAINSWHADMGLAKPAVGQAINMLRRGYGEVQGDEDDEAVRARRPIPAYVMRALLTLAHSTPSLPIRRAATASVLCYTFMLRADSCVRLKHHHVSFTSQGLALQLHVKTRGRDVSTTVHRPGHDEVYHLLRDWVRMCRAPGQVSLWALPDRQHDTFTSPCINRWFQASCDILGLRPPQGEKWVGHSHRSGGATAALSIDASLPAIARFGVWDHIGSLQAYLDASVGPSVDALLFFEHLLKPSLHAVREQLSAQRAQAQGLPRTYSGVLLGDA